MKKHLTLFVVLCLVVLTMSTTGAFAENVPMCRLGANPVDTSRDVDWTYQCLLTLSSPQVVRMASGSGAVSTCGLATGTSVVISKDTGRADDVRFCSNPLVDHPILAGQRDCAPPAPPAVEKLVVQTEARPKLNLIVSGSYVPPPPPPVVVVKHHKVWPWVVGAIIIGAIAMAGHGGGSSPSQSGPPNIQ